jgi:hypothetical protein
MLLLLLLLLLVRCLRSCMMRMSRITEFSLAAGAA